MSFPAPPERQLSASLPVIVSAPDPAMTLSTSPLIVSPSPVSSLATPSSVIVRLFVFSL